MVRDGPNDREPEGRLIDMRMMWPKLGHVAGLPGIDQAAFISHDPSWVMGRVPRESNRRAGHPH